MSYSSDGKYQTTFYFGYLQLNNIESNFYERMIKALLHLATFCENTKETF